MIRAYEIIGILVLAFMAYVHATGWTYEDITQVHQVPRTVRDNPGAYRAHYASYTHYTGGK